MKKVSLKLICCLGLLSFIGTSLAVPCFSEAPAKCCTTAQLDNPAKK